MKKIAFEAMKDVLTLSATQTIALAKEKTTWGMDEYKIPVPGAPSPEQIAKVEGITMVGPTLAKAIMAPFKNISDAFVDAAVTVVASPECLTAYTTPIGALTDTQAIEVCQKGVQSTALVDYLVEQAGAKIQMDMKAVVTALLSDPKNPLTKAWDGGIKAYNSAISNAAVAKLGLEFKPIELDLADHVLSSIVASLGKMLCSKEKEIKASPANYPELIGNTHIAVIFPGPEHIYTMTKATADDKLGIQVLSVGEEGADGLPKISNVAEGSLADQAGLKLPPKESEPLRVVTVNGQLVVGQDDVIAKTKESTVVTIVAMPLKFTS